MNYGDIKKVDVANGPGVRVSLFVSGCTNHCKGCFNPDTWDFEYGEKFTTDNISQIISLLQPDHINGLTLLGGDPMHPRNCCCDDVNPTVYNLVKEVKEAYPNKDIWCYTGYTYDQLLLNNTQFELLNMLDVLVDGPFIEERKDLSLRFRGSSNQRIIDVNKSLINNEIILFTDF